MRRAGLALAALALTLAAHAQPRSDPRVYGGDPPQIAGVDILFVDDPALVQMQYRPAGGPLNRYLSRPGAWYAAVFVPLAAGWPAQLWIWQASGGHELRLLALDASPIEKPTVSAPIPVLHARGGARAPWVSAPFSIAPAADGDGAFVLIEQWNARGERPGPLWVQARSRSVEASAGTPWWATRAEGPGSELAPAAPPSPMQDARDRRTVVELPIKRRFGITPQFTPWPDPWAPR